MAARRGSRLRKRRPRPSIAWWRSGAIGIVAIGQNCYAQAPGAHLHRHKITIATGSRRPRRPPARACCQRWPCRPEEQPWPWQWNGHRRASCSTSQQCSSSAWKLIGGDCSRVPRRGVRMRHATRLRSRCDKRRTRCVRGMGPKQCGSVSRTHCRTLRCLIRCLIRRRRCHSRRTTH